VDGEPAPSAAASGSAGPGGAASASADATAAIRHLGELRDQGLLSDEEFESKKRELLARI
jgi:hypothetical protein